jgi:hypothetical protein
MHIFYQVDHMASSPEGRTVLLRAFDADSDNQTVGYQIFKLPWIIKRSTDIESISWSGQPLDLATTRQAVCRLLDLSVSDIPKP